MPSASATTGPENPLKVYSDSEKAQIAQAAEASKAAYDAWKDAKARGESKDHVDDLLDKAMQASEVEKGLQDLCD